MNYKQHLLAMKKHIETQNIELGDMQRRLKDEAYELGLACARCQVELLEINKQLDEIAKDNKGD